METLKDIFVPYEIAQKLKEIGFNEPCLAHYDDGKLIEITYPLFSFNNEYKPIAPTYEQVFKWFREKGFDMFIRRSAYESAYFFEIYKSFNKSGFYMGKIDRGRYPTIYEEAREQLILKLIEIYEQDNKVPSVGQEE